VNLSLGSAPPSLKGFFLYPDLAHALIPCCIVFEVDPRFFMFLQLVLGTRPIASLPLAGHTFFVLPKAFFSINVCATPDPLPAFKILYFFPIPVLICFYPNLIMVLFVSYSLPTLRISIFLSFFFFRSKSQLILF